MHSLPILDDLPAGFFVEESPKGILALHVDVARAMHEAGLGPEHDGPMELSDLSGRRPLMQLEVAGERYVVRRFRRGGLFRWFMPEVFRSAERPFRELMLSDALARCGIPTPQVVGARALVRPGGWSLEVISRRVDGAIDLGLVMAKMGKGEIAPAARARIFHAVGGLVRRLHAVGFLHADLTPRNILIRREAMTSAVPEPWVLDLDDSVFAENMTVGERRRNLRRLYRWASRRSPSQGIKLSLADQAHFMRGYDPEGTHWREDWRAINRRHQMGKSVHMLGWFMESLLGSGPEKRDGSTPGGLPA